MRAVKPLGTVTAYKGYSNTMTPRTANMQYQSPVFPTPQVSSYLLAEAFLSECLAVLAEVLTPENCLPYLGLAEDISCAKLRTTVFTFLSRNLLEQSHLTRYDCCCPLRLRCESMVMYLTA